MIITNMARLTVLHSISELQSLPGPVALAIGVFDGVHLGHQEVIRAAVEHTAQHGGTAVVMTFDPHPLHVLRPDSVPDLLCSTTHKLRILEQQGISHVLLCPFDAAFAATLARDFTLALADACNPLGFVSVGYSWRFGKGGAGDIHLLMDMGQELGFGVYGVPPVRIAGEVVSSTLIREAVSVGGFAKARLLLGRDYTVFGKIIEGDKLGRQLGFPTANIDYETEQLPPAGVYAVRALLNGDAHRGVANLGRRPTITGGAAALTLEVHLLDFAGDIYGSTMEVVFTKHLRAEKKFSGLDALKDQIAADITAARAFF